MCTARIYLRPVGVRSSSTSRYQRCRRPTRPRQPSGRHHGGDARRVRHGRHRCGCTIRVWTVRPRRPFPRRRRHHRDSVPVSGPGRRACLRRRTRACARACAADIVFGADLPVAKSRMPKEDRAKSFFATDMTEAQWADVWNQFVPESPVLWNARLSGVPDCVGDFRQHDRGRRGAPGTGKADDRQPWCRGGPSGAFCRSHRDGDQASRARAGNQRIRQLLT